jgi:hypothetical protein
MNQRLIYRLDDSVLAQLVKLFQLAIVTNTDISDHMRCIVLEPDKDRTGVLLLTPEYKEKDACDIQKFLDEAIKRLETVNEN